MILEPSTETPRTSFSKDKHFWLPTSTHLRVPSEFKVNRSWVPLRNTVSDIRIEGTSSDFSMDLMKDLKIFWGSLKKDDQDDGVWKGTGVGGVKERFFFKVCIYSLSRQTGKWKIGGRLLLVTNDWIFPRETNHKIYKKLNMEGINKLEVFEKCIVRLYFGLKFGCLSHLSYFLFLTN